MQGTMIKGISPQSNSRTPEKQEKTLKRNEKENNKNS